jgi:putative hemolysin
MMVIPRKNFRIPSFTEYVSNLNLDSETTEIAKSLIPPLLGFYLKAGAYICGEPALDKAFKCIDFFTILDMNNLRKNLEKKYNV